MHDLHIGDFCNDAAKILIALYRRFPVKNTLYMEDIIGPDTPDEFGLHSPRHMACFGAALWLAEEGYFRYSQPVYQEALEDVVLSQKAFLHFASCDKQQLGTTRIKQLTHVLANESSETLSQYLLAQFTAFEKMET